MKQPSLPSRSEVLAIEIMKCNKLLAKLWADESRSEVLRRRRSLFRLLHNLPLMAQVPPDWIPSEPHPVWSKFPALTHPFTFA